MKNRKALLIVNRGSRQGEEELASALDQLRAHGIEVLRQDVQMLDEVRNAVQRHSSSVDCMIVGGGDGSIQAAASALANRDLPLGILPLGTANDLARTIGLGSKSLVEAAQVIIDGRVRSIDVGQANGAVFVNVAHIGLGARMHAELSPQLKQRWGRFSYLRALISAFVERRPFEAVLEYGDVREVAQSIQIAVGNGRYYGGGMTISDEAGIDDGILHVYSVAPARWTQLLAMALRLRRGEAQPDDPVRLLSAAEVTIKTRRAMRVTADGEWITKTPVEFRVLPGALQVYA
jgi:diacylglycerol kinase (ATP)